MFCFVDWIEEHWFLLLLIGGSFYVSWTLASGLKMLGRSVSTLQSVLDDLINKKLGD